LKEPSLDRWMVATAEPYNAITQFISDLRTTDSFSNYQPSLPVINITFLLLLRYFCANYSFSSINTLLSHFSTNNMSRSVEEIVSLAKHYLKSSTKLLVGSRLSLTAAKEAKGQQKQFYIQPAHTLLEKRASRQAQTFLPLKVPTLSRSMGSN
jgi:hypothetical protein